MSHCENDYDVIVRFQGIDLYFVSSQERPWRHSSRQRRNATKRIICASISGFLFERVRKHSYIVSRAITCVLFCTTQWRHSRSRGETKYSCVKVHVALATLFNINSYHMEIRCLLTIDRFFSFIFPYSWAQIMHGTVRFANVYSKEPRSLAYGHCQIYS